MPENQLPELPSASTFASELIRARAELGLTQNKLSEKSGISLSAIKGYEAGRNMPGARELRELCQALQVSPNKLLFGTELPFETQSFADLLIEGTSEPVLVQAARVTLLFPLLSKDEQEALSTLVRSLTVARHGIEKVKETLTAADLFAGLGRELAKHAGHAIKSPGYELEGKAVAESLEQFMVRQGHIEDPEKLPKK